MGTVLGVLLADDSPTARQLLAHTINAADGMRVIGQAYNGKQAVRMAHELHPDIILMDITMPEMGGLEATREIMNDVPTPIVMISADTQETDVAFQALRLGALSVMKKPVGPTHPDYVTQAAGLVSTIRAMADVRVIHHWKTHTPAQPVEAKVVLPRDQKSPEIVVIAASTGGPAALTEIFKRLPANFSLPVVVVQHISTDFLTSLVEWLDVLTPLTVDVAREGERPLPGRIYFAPGGKHLKFTRGKRFEFDDLTKSLHMPSGDMLLTSAASVYGANAIGIVLTGMGNDGAMGLRALYNRGAYTVAQDESTSVIYGMPGEAVALGAAKIVLSIQNIAQVLIDFHMRKTPQAEANADDTEI
jgi:two-component system, chemotaxis family, protein-glutamate methylesterase/glutaminase